MDVSDLLKVSSNPHIRSKDTTSRIMLYVIISLLPAAGFGVYNFGDLIETVRGVGYKIGGNA